MPIERYIPSLARNVSSKFCYAQRVAGVHSRSSRSSVQRSMTEEFRREREENELWSREAGAKDALSPPPFEGLALTSVMMESLDSYLEARSWQHSGGPARRFLSHLLTFPLTLAKGLREAGLSSSSTTPARWDATADTTEATSHAEASAPAKANVRRLCVVCVGARAESSLPPVYWREVLFALSELERLDLHFIGPEASLPSVVTAPLRTDTAERAHRARHVIRAGERTLELAWTKALVRRDSGTGRVRVGGASEGTAEARETAAAEAAIAEADAFVLFNPGVGHPHLRKGWEGATEGLLATGRPIIVSCHSRKDLQRDVEEMQAIAKRRCEDLELGRGAMVSPVENPFRSLIVSEDPLSNKSCVEYVSSNWGVFVIPGRFCHERQPNRGRVTS